MKTLKQERGYGNNMKKLLLGIGVGIGVVTALALAPVGFNPVNNTEAATEQTQPERIPFTNKDVTPGDPESYIGTYGQCPFYENAGEKGCYPPSDIECNADWSVCNPKTESEGSNESSSGVSGTGSTTSQEEHSTSYTCGK